MNWHNGVFTVFFILSTIGSVEIQFSSMPEIVSRLEMVSFYSENLETSECKKEIELVDNLSIYFEKELRESSYNKKEIRVSDYELIYDVSFFWSEPVTIKY